MQKRRAPDDSQSTKREKIVEDELFTQRMKDGESAFFKVMTTHDLLKHICMFHIDTKSIDSFEDIVKRGNSYALINLPKLRIPWDNEIDIAAKYGELDILIWLKSKGYQVSPWIINIVIEREHLNVLKWLTEVHLLDAIKGCTFSSIFYAFTCGHLKILKILFKKGIITASYMQVYGNTMMHTTVSRGHLKLAKWFYKKFPDFCDENHIDNASQSGVLEMVKWTHKTFPLGHCTKKAVHRAAKLGYSDIVEFLLFNRKEGQKDDTFEATCKNGHLEVVKILNAICVVKCTTEAMDYAAENE